MDEIILIGAGGHARSCIDVIEMDGRFKIAGLIEKDETTIQDNLGYPIIGTDADLPSLRSEFTFSLITIGQIKSYKKRYQIYLRLIELDYKLPVIISPRAYVSKHSKIGDGTIIMHNSIINANSIIGKNCIINNKVLIEHDANIGDNCHISTGAIINGNVNVGFQSFVGSGVVTKQSISIGNNCIVGAGTVLKKDLVSNTLIK